MYMDKHAKKSRIRETPNLSIDADSRTDTILKVNMKKKKYIVTKKKLGGPLFFLGGRHDFFYGLKKLGEGVFGRVR